MQLVQVDTGHWRMEFESGIGLELVLLFSRCFAFWRFGGSVVREANVGES